MHVHNGMSYNSGTQNTDMRLVLAEYNSRFDKADGKSQIYLHNNNS